jgi:hypothetical protein
MRSKVRLSVIPAAIFIIGTAMSLSANAAPNDACSLLTQAQIKSVLNLTVSTGTATPDKKACSWSVSNPVPKGVRFFTVTLESTNSFQGGKFASVAIQGVTVTSASGVGEDAYYLTASAFVFLHVKKGAVAFRISLYAGTDITIEKTEDMEKTLALQIASEL